MSSLSTSLKNSYQRYLQPYEEWVKSAKPGVQQQIDAEYGITPSPSGSPNKKTTMDRPLHSPVGSSFGPDSPALGDESVGTPDKSDFDMMDATSSRSDIGTPSGFTAINSGFTPVNSGPSTFTHTNTNGMRREMDIGLTPIPRRLDNGYTSRRESPETQIGSPLKRQHSQDDCRDSTDLASDTNSKSEDSENGERRSKRLKKGAFCLYCDFSLLKVLG